MVRMQTLCAAWVLVIGAVLVSPARATAAVADPGFGVVTETPVGAAQALGLDSPGGQLFTANSDASLSVVKTEPFDLTAQVPLPINPAGIAVDPGTDRLFVTNGAYRGGAVSIYNEQTHALESTLPAGVDPGAVYVDQRTHWAFVSAAGTPSPDEGFISPQITAIGPDNTVRWTARPSEIQGMALDPGLNALYIGNDFQVVGYDEFSGSVRSTFSVDGAKTELAVDPTSHDIYLWTQYPGIIVLDSTGHKLATFGQQALADGGHIALDPVARRIYLTWGADFLGQANITVYSMVDYSTIATVHLGAGNTPSAIVADPVTHRVYVASDTARRVWMMSDHASPPATTDTELELPTTTAGSALTFTARVSPVPTGGTVTFAMGPIDLPDCRQVPVDPRTGAAVCTTPAWTQAGTWGVSVHYSDGPDALGSSAVGSVLVTPAAGRVTVLSGADQTSPVGVPLPADIGLYVADNYGNAVPYIPVTVRVTSGGATFHCDAQGEFGSGYVYCWDVVLTTPGRVDFVASIAGAPSSTSATFSEYGGQTADVSAAMSQPATADPGSVVTVKLSVHNAGPATAHYVVGKVHLPDGVTVVSAPGGYVDGDTVYFATWAVASGQTVQAQVDARMPTTAGTVTVSFAAGSGVSDPVPRNNYASASTTVR